MHQWRQMTGDGTTEADWNDPQLQTWSALIPPGDIPGDLTYDGLKDIVQRQFNYVYAQPGQQDATVCMVAAYYDPDTRTVYSSTVPYGGRKRVMQLTAARDAPVWFKQVEDFPLSHPPWHAEDGAYYTYEVTSDRKPIAPRYNQGSMVAAYGRRAPKDRIGLHPPCSIGTRGNPTCQQVASALGVAMTQPRRPPAQALAPASDPDPSDTTIGFNDGLTDEQWTLLLGDVCVTGTNHPPRAQKKRSAHGSGLERRASGVSCVSVNVQSSVPIMSLASPLPTSDISSVPASSDIQTLTAAPIMPPPGSQPSPRIPITPLSKCEWEEDPDEAGPPGCGCNGYIGKLPALPGTDSCAYTAVPASIGPLTSKQSGLNPTNPFPCTSTNLANGIVAAYQGEGPISGYAGVQCTGANSPISTLPPVPSTTVFVGNDSFNVGKSFGNPLYSGLSSLLVSACPTGGSCDNSPSKWKINDVTTYDTLNKDEHKDAGSIVMNVVDSSYTPQLLPALIARAASAVNSSAQGNMMCRTLNTCNQGSARAGDGCNKADVFCRATDYVAVVTQEKGSGNGQIVAHLEIELKYDAHEDPFDKGVCDLVVAAVDAGLQLLGPELEPADVAAAGEAGALCREGEQLAQNIQSVVAVATAIG